MAKNISFREVSKFTRAVFAVAVAVAAVVILEEGRPITLGDVHLCGARPAISDFPYLNRKPNYYKSHLNATDIKTKSTVESVQAN